MSLPNLFSAKSQVVLQGNGNIVPIGYWNAFHSGLLTFLQTIGMIGFVNGTSSMVKLFLYLAYA